MKKTMVLLAMLATAQVQALDGSQTSDEEGVWRRQANDPLAGYNYTVALPGSGEERVDFTIACHPSLPVALDANLGYSHLGDMGYGGVGLVIDGKRFENIRQLGEDFPAFWEALRHAKQVEMLTSDQQVPLPIEGLTAALPAVDSPEYICKARPKPEPVKTPDPKGVWKVTGDANKGYQYSVQAPAGYRVFAITCAPNKPVDLNVAIDANNYGTSATRSDFVFVIDGKRYDAKAALAENFADVWDALRAAKQLDVYPTGAGYKVSFPTNNLANTLPARESEAFPCQTAQEISAAQLEDDLANIEPLKEGDVQLRKRGNPYYGKTTWNKYLLDITSRSNRMVITDLKINRGRCTIDPQAKLPFRMGFGGKITLSMQPADCNPLEVTVTTLGGEQTLSFDQ
ncbi:MULTISPECIES: hypothetical protein [Aeromonas]|uniref:hypothetical protein n=1 Tax=Aeromonas veronii TaxID=654 RepID=UPI002B4A96D4|nr:hypothetical protein [Aeromonas veronii]